MAADLDMRAVDPALQLRPEALKGVDGSAALAGVLPLAMVEGDVRVTAQADFPVVAKFVGADRRAGQDVGVDKGAHRLLVAAGDDLGGNLAAALHHTDHSGLVSLVSAALAFNRTTDKRLVDLGMRAETAKRAATVDSAHILADHVAHAPSRLVGNAKLALDFLGRNAIPRRAKPKHHGEPIAKRRARAIEGRSGGRIDLMGAPLTLIGPAAHNARVPRRASAAGAIKVIAVANLKQVIETAILGREAALKLAERGGFRLHANYLAEPRTCRKGIISIDL